MSAARLELEDPLLVLVTLPSPFAFSVTPATIACVGARDALVLTDDEILVDKLELALELVPTVVLQPVVFVTLLAAGMTAEDTETFEVLNIGNEKLVVLLGLKELTVLFLDDTGAVLVLALALEVNVFEDLILLVFTADEEGDDEDDGNADDLDTAVDELSTLMSFRLSAAPI